MLVLYVVGGKVVVQESFYGLGVCKERRGEEPRGRNEATSRKLLVIGLTSLVLRDNRDTHDSLNAHLPLFSPCSVKMRRISQERVK